MSTSQVTELNDAYQHRTAAQVAMDILLLFAAPFITLAYLVLFPFIAAVMLIRRDERLWRR